MEKTKYYIEVTYKDDTDFHFDIEVEGNDHKKEAILMMVTRGTLMASNGVEATAYNYEGFPVCAYRK